MKKIFTSVIVFLTINSFGQIDVKKHNGLKIEKQETFDKNDTIIKVVYNNKIKNTSSPAYFLNGKLINESLINTIDPNEIENLKVEKENIEIENVKYFGKILIDTKAGYIPKIISLNNLKLKYTNINDSSAIFQLDNEIINSDYNEYLVDENYILRIEVEKYENGNIRLHFIKIYTKSKENVINSKKIIIRGNGEFEVNK